MPYRRKSLRLQQHSALDPTFLGSFKRLFSQRGCYLDIDMTRRVDWHSRRGPHSTHFLDEPATNPPTCEFSILVPELRASLSQLRSEDSNNNNNNIHSKVSDETESAEGHVDKDIWMLRIRQTRIVTVRDVLVHLDRFLYAEVPASYWPEDPQMQERIEAAHRLRVKHLARTHGKSARVGARMSFSISSGARGAGAAVHIAPLCFMQVVECAEVDENGRMVKRDRKVAPRIDWLGGKFFFAGLKKSEDRDREADFVLNMEAPWARRRRSVN